MNFDPDTITVLHVVAACPASQDVFRRYDAAAGRCLLCEGLFETVSSLATRFGLDRERLVADLQAVCHKEEP